MLLWPDDSFSPSTRASIVAVSVLCASFLPSCTHAPPAARASDAQPSSAPALRLREDIEYLAGPQLAGRRAGTPGSDSAANYIARRLADLELRPAFGKDGCAAIDCRPSYLQLFRLGEVVSTNVGAIVVGSDSALRHDYVAITAHYDHLGRTRTDARDPEPAAVHPGADDNASGTAAILELARRLAERPPRRSVMIIAFGAEELGLVGSRAFTEHPPVDLRRIAIALNLDMVGRLRQDRVSVYGVDTPSIRALVDSANAPRPLVLTFDPKSSGRSDDFSFAAHGVRALHVTTGTHSSYHRATDVPSSIDLGGLQRVTDFVERIARLAAGMK